ncbi:MAG: hypothetical protein LBG11_00970 [Bifidobacteriaceae bacterium]|jgi:hypothetical protein|nr:hypothetical protein [Bifidobacteriaceae bacterium]
MTFHKREFTPEERAYFDSFGLKKPWGPGDVSPGNPCVDDETGAMLVGIGGGALEIPQFWVFLLGSHCIWLSGNETSSGNRLVGRHLAARIDAVGADDSPLWKMPGIYRLIRDGLICSLANVFHESVLSARFYGDFGSILEEKGK